MVRPADEDVMHVVVDARPAFGPRLATVVADVDAADLYSGDHTVRRVGVRAETPDVGLVAVARRVPRVARGQVLKAR